MFIAGKPAVRYEGIRALFNTDKIDVSNLQNVFFFSKGREALCTGLSLLSSVQNRRVWLPAYICKSVTEAVYKAGFEPVFYEIKKNLEPDWERIYAEKNDIFIIVHYFGISQDIGKAKSFFNNKNIIVIEDGAHTIPYIFYGKHATDSDMAIFSLRKVLAVPDGGILIINNQDIISRSNDIDKFRNIPSPRISTKKLLQMVVESIAFKTGFNIISLKRCLKNNLSHETWSDIKGISRQTLSLLQSTDFDTIIQRRVENFNRLLSLLLPVEKIYLPFKKLPDNSIPQVLPVWIGKTKELVKTLHNKGIEAYQWPDKELPSEVEIDKFPVTKDWVDKCILLPIHHSLTESHIEYIADTIKQVISNV